MKPLITATLALAALAGVAYPIDFTPAHGIKQLEGVNIALLLFNDRGTAISYQPPGGWSAAGQPNLLTLIPNSGSEAKVTFATRRLSADETARLADPEVEQAWITQLLPPIAQDIKLLEVNPSPYMLGSHESREWVFNYYVGGYLNAISISRCDLPTERFMMILDAKSKDFAAIRKEAIASLFSWTWR